MAVNFTFAPDLPLMEINGRLSRHKSLAQNNVQELTTELCLSAAEASGATLPRNFTMSPADAYNNTSKETPTRCFNGHLAQERNGLIYPSNNCCQETLISTTSPDLSMQEFEKSPSGKRWTEADGKVEPLEHLRIWNKDCR